MADQILIIDDDVEVSKMVAESLEDEDYKVFQSKNEAEAFDILRGNSSIATVFLDLWFGVDENAGFKILKKIKKEYPDIPVVMISGHGNVENAVLAIKKGAYDFIEKPFRLDKLLLVTKRSVELYNLKKSNADGVNDCTPYLLGSSTEIQSLHSSLKKIADSKSRVLFIAEGVGVGTELMALYLHNNSSNKFKKFVYINCYTADEDELIKSIFGEFVHGINVGGVFDDEETGTVFLDNVFNMPMSVQTKFLSYLKSDNFNNNIRIISSSGKVDFHDLVSKKIFIEDLLYRLNVVTLTVPSIASRKEDISPIIDYFIKNSLKIYGIEPKTVSSEAKILLMAYDWPGNVKQIKNIIEYLLLMSKNERTIKIEHIPDEVKYRKANDPINITKLIDIPLKDARNLFEKYYIETQIAKFSGNISEVSRFIGMERSALHRKIKTLCIKETDDINIPFNRNNM